jgi:hypothetical protein
MGDNDQKILELMEKQNAVLSGLSDRLVEKDAAATMTANKLHGVGGLWSVPGLERDIITAHISPFGIGSELPMFPSSMEDPRFGSLTGFTAVVGSQPSGACGDAPYAYTKGCTLTARFGLLRFDTNTIEIDKVGLQINRGDFTDLVLRGRVLGYPSLDPKNLNPNQILNILTMSEMVTVGVSFERALATQIWQGVRTIANQFPGLDVQIATGQVDAETNVACPALDSDVKDFNYDLVGGTGRDIVQYMSMMEYYLTFNAQNMGLMPAKWVIAMRPQLWFELSKIWPCTYLADGCKFQGTTSSGNAAAFIVNDNVNVDLRDRMRDTKQIPINGNWYDVVTDTGIYEHTNITNAQLRAGEYASSIYFVPMVIQGNFPVTYREYVDYTKAAGDTALLHGLETFWTDGGAYFWASEYEKWCYKLAAKTEQRVVLRTPQLAGKIQRVKYTPLQHLREPDPASPYFADGGVSLRGHTWGRAVWDGSQR